MRIRNLIPLFALLGVALAAPTHSAFATDLYTCQDSCAAPSHCIAKDSSAVFKDYVCVSQATYQQTSLQTNSFYTDATCAGVCPGSCQQTDIQGAAPTYSCKGSTFSRLPDCNGQCSSGTTCQQYDSTWYYCGQPAQVGTNTSCTGTGCNIQYVPLEPLPSGLPGQTAVNYSDIGAYLNYLFPILVMVGAIIAVATFTVYGFVYMTSSVAGDKSKARSRMLKSIGGLVLLLSSVLILRTINPALVNFNLSSLGQIKNYQGNSSGQSILIQTPEQTGQTEATPNYANTPLQDAAGTGQQP